MVEAQGSMNQLERKFQKQIHRSGRAPWLRAAVLGANDAIVSIASLTIGVTSAHASRETTLLAGFSGLAAGALSMAVGEFVSVSSQRDAEEADVEREKLELTHDPEVELHELALIYEERGLTPKLAMEVAEALSIHDRVAAHLRDELGIVESLLAKPFQAAWISAVSFLTMGSLPLAAFFVASDRPILYVSVSSLLGLAALGAFGGYLGGAPKRAAALRVTVGGGIAMLITAALGHFLGG